MGGRYVLVYASLLMCGLLFLASALHTDQISVDYEVGLGDLISSALAASGILGLLLTLHQISHAARSSRAQFVLEINKQFMADDLRAFYYRLDYEGERAFVFNEKKFAHSEDERLLDRLLYSLAFVGKLLRTRVLEKSDLMWIRTIATRTLRNKEVLKYLESLKAGIPDHSGFTDALHLYKALCGESDQTWPRLSAYLTTPSA